MQYYHISSQSLQNRNVFAQGLNYYKLFWIFFVCCILGVIVELGECCYSNHRFESRSGVIYGWFNPVYGFGALLMTLCLFKLKNKAAIFLGSAVIGGAFEYICSVFQETAFGTVSWNYDDLFGSIGGRTSFRLILTWGVLGLAWMELIYPFFSKWIEKIPRKIGVPLTWVLTVFMICNMTVSSLATYRQKERRMGYPPSNALEEFMDVHYTDEFLKKVYPNMIIVK